MLKYDADNNKSGYVLVVTMIAIVFVSLIGVALLRVAYSDYINTNFYIKHRQAYLIARSGAKAVTEWIKDQDNDASVLVGKTTDEIDLGSGSYQVTVNKKGNVFTINSVGKVGDIEKGVGVEVEKIQKPNIDHTVFADQGLFINSPNLVKDKGNSGNKGNKGNSGNGEDKKETLTFGTNLLKGDENVDIHKKIKGAIELDYDLGYEYTLPTWPEPDFKAPSDDDVSNLYMGTILDDNMGIRFDYDEMIIGSGSTLTINVYNDQDINIYVNSLELKGDIVVNTYGEGIVNFIIQDTLNITSKASINSDGKTDHLNIYHYNKNDKFKLSGKRTMNANFYTQSTDIQFTGQGQYYGNLFVYNNADIKLSGNGGAQRSIIYAPKSSVTITGSSAFKGAIITNIATFTGNGSLYGDPENIKLPESFETKTIVRWRDI